MSALFGRVSRVLWLAAEGLRAVADELHLLSIRTAKSAAPADDRIATTPAQDPLTPEAEALFWREERRGAGLPDKLETPLEALGRNVNGPDEFRVAERRVRRS